MKLFTRLLPIFIGLFFLNAVLAQPGSSIDLEKPTQYENRTLASEKSEDKKFTAPKRFFNNTITHFNYYFNANTLLNEVIDQSRNVEKVDYLKLLPFYSYSLDATANNSNLDSIIYKCNAGILLHDLRSDWVDDMYFIMGKAYFFRKNFDSAGMVFRYMNYAFAKKDDGYDIPIGSNASGTNVFSISTDEKVSTFKKITTKPPMRNESLLWLALNDIYENKAAEGAGILEILYHDPLFPERLKQQLSETLAYRYYLEKNYDSSAFHLAKTISLSENKQDQARREYLIGQMYMLAGQGLNSSKYFAQSAEHSIDPVMAVYASLYASTASIEDTTGFANEKIKSLLRLSQKERFRDYRDIIYYNIALAEMQNNDRIRAKIALKKSISLSTKNPAQKSNSFFMLGNINYEEGNFEDAANNYDSVDASSILDDAARDLYTERAPFVRQMADNMYTIHRQDSLQMIARLPETERTTVIKKILRQLLKEQGMKDSDADAFINPAVQSSGDLFSGPQENPVNSNSGSGSKGDWYFNNQSLKSSGFQSFQALWGKRPNVDNWNRQEAVSSFNDNSANNENTEDNGENEIAAEEETDDSTSKSDDISKIENNDMIKMGSRFPSSNTFGKKSGVPQLAVVNKSSVNNTDPGELSYDALLSNVPTSEEKLQESKGIIADALFENGQILQNKLENYSAAIATYENLNINFPENGHLEESLFNLYYCYNKVGKSFKADSVQSVLNLMFADGQFASALNKKPVAKNDQQSDPATKEYERIYELFVSGKFQEAETSKKDADALYDKSYWTPQLLYIESIYYVSTKQDSIAIEELVNLKDLYANTPLAEKAERMIDVLNRRSEIESYLTDLEIKRYAPDEVAPIINLNPIEQFADEQKSESPKFDSVISKPAIKQASIIVDTSKNEIKNEVINYTFNPADGQYFAVILNNVAPVFINETKNAFNRYNASNFYNQKINSTITKLSDTFSIVLFGPFVDASAALIYADKIKPVAPRTIIPWLTPNKYSFTMISDTNLGILAVKKDIDNYKQLIQQTLPGKF